MESGVGHAQKTPLQEKKFESLEEGQAYLDHWEERWADTRIHGTTRRQVAAMFAEEKHALLPLPIDPFRYYRYDERTVHLDGCVEVEKAYYGAPPGWIVKRVQVQWNDAHVRLLNPRDGQLLREHLKQSRSGRRIAEQDKPTRTPLGTLKLLNRAATAGKNIGALCRAMHEREGQAAVRRMLGLLSLAKKYGAVTCDDACELGLETGEAIITSSAAIWSTAHRLRSACGRSTRSFVNSRFTATSLTIAKQILYPPTRRTTHEPHRT